jgi:hypothetical protein
MAMTLILRREMHTSTFLQLLVVDGDAVEKFLTLALSSLGARINIDKKLRRTRRLRVITTDDGVMSACKT